MKIKHSRPKGTRIMKGSWKTKEFGKVHIFASVYCYTSGYWWLNSSKKWGTVKEANLNGESFSSSMSGVYSIKAFRRRLKEWAKYMPKGTKFILQSNFVGLGAIGII